MSNRKATARAIEAKVKDVRDCLDQIERYTLKIHRRLSQIDDIQRKLRDNERDYQ